MLKQNVYNKMRGHSRGNNQSKLLSDSPARRNKSPAYVPEKMDPTLLPRDYTKRERECILNAKIVFHKKKRIYRFNQIAEYLDLKKGYKNWLKTGYSKGSSYNV